MRPWESTATAWGKLSAAGSLPLAPKARRKRPPGSPPGIVGRCQPPEVLAVAVELQDFVLHAVNGVDRTVEADGHAPGPAGENTSVRGHGRSPLLTVPVQDTDDPLA